MVVKTKHDVLLVEVGNKLPLHTLEDGRKNESQYGT